MMRRLTLSAGVLAAMVAASSFLGAQQPAPAAPGAAAPAPAAGQRGGGRGAPPIKSPEVSSDGRVTFRLRAPNAKEVAVALGGNRLPMQKDEQGVWSATTEVMAPDYYTYALVVDGTTVSDPANRQVQTSYGSFQSMFVVPGAQPWLPAPGVPRGAIARHTFHSTVANDDRDFFVYTPPGYDARRSRPYPIMFVLHGLGDDAERWMNGGAANVILDNLIAQGKAVPMVMVTTLGYGVSNGPAGAMAPESITGYTRSLLTEVLPAVEKGYNVSRNREERAIAGLSMGGAETLYTALNNLDKFAWIGSFSGAFVMWPGASQPGGGRAGTPAAAAPAPGAPAPAAPSAAAPAAPSAAAPAAPSAAAPAAPIAAAPAAPTAAAAPAAPAPGATAAAAGPAAGGRGRGAIRALDVSVFEKNFPTLDAKANSQIKMLWITCGTADSLIGVNRQFKDWLRSKNVKFTEEEAADVGHVWPLWRKNLTEFAQQAFQSRR